MLSMELLQVLLADSNGRYMILLDNGDLFTGTVWASKPKKVRFAIEQKVFERNTLYSIPSDMDRFL